MPNSPSERPPLRSARGPTVLFFAGLLLLAATVHWRSSLTPERTAASVLASFAPDETKTTATPRVLSDAEVKVKKPAVSGDDDYSLWAIHQRIAAVPPPPAIQPTASSVHAEATRLKLQSIVIGPRRTCLINNTLYREGDVIAGFTVRRITRAVVLLEKASTQVELRLSSSARVRPTSKPGG